MFPELPMALFWNMPERKKSGILECILGRRSDLCSDSDLNGKNKTDAGADHGVISMRRSGTRSNWNL